MEILSFSGKDLVTRSAMQLCYMRNHKVERIVNYNMIIGEQHQHDIAQRQKGVYEEMKTVLRYNDIVISCCHDIVDRKSRIVTEVKNIDPDRPLEEWYFRNSIVQCVLYSTICHFNGNVFITPVFRIKQRFKQDGFFLTNIEYHLLFGKDEYNVIVKDYDIVLSYFLTKANCSKDYNSAKQYDEIHKFKHFEDLSNYFEYKQLK